MKWHLSHRADKRALPLANRHYNRQSPNSPQFVPPGRCLVLLTQDTGALFVSSWPLAAYVKHAWAGRVGQLSFSPRIRPACFRSHSRCGCRYRRRLGAAVYYLPLLWRRYLYGDIY